MHFEPVPIPMFPIPGQFWVRPFDDLEYHMNAFYTICQMLLIKNVILGAKLIVWSTL